MARPASPAVARLTMLLAVLASRRCPDRADRLRREGGGDDDRLGRAATLMLDYFPNADHAGIYQAAAQNQFGEAGISLKIQQPGNPADR